jgi:hypothetical protein
MLNAGYVPGTIKTRPIDWVEVNNIKLFGAGHGRCVGRSITAMSVIKLLAALWMNCEFNSIDTQEELLAY